MKDLDIELKNFRYVARSPAIPILVKGWAHLIESNWCSIHAVLLESEHSVIVAYDQDQMVGALTYSLHPAEDCACIHLLMVEEQHRRRGIGTALQSRLMEIAQAQDIGSVQGTVTANNKVSAASAQSTGRVPRYVTYELEF